MRFSQYLTDVMQRAQQAEPTIADDKPEEVTDIIAEQWKAGAPVVSCALSLLNWFSLQHGQGLSETLDLGS